MLLFRTLVASWRYQWQQLLLVIFAIFTASSGLSCVLLLNEQAKQKMQQLDVPAFATPIYMASSINGQTLTKDDYTNLLRDGSAIVAIANFNIAIGQEQFPALAIDVSALMSQQQFSQKNAAEVSLDFSLWQTPLVAPEQWQKLKLLSQQYGNWSLPAPRAVNFLQTNSIYMSMSLASTINPVAINQLWIYQELNETAEHTLKNNGFKIVPVASTSNNLTDSFYLNITAMGLLMFLVCMFITFNGVKLLLDGRKLLMTQLFNLGVSKQQLLSLFALEANLATVFLSSIGFLAGSIFAEKLSPGMNLTLQQLYDINTDTGRISLFRTWFQVMLASLLAINLLFAITGSKAVNDNKEIASDGNRIKQEQLILALSVSLTVLLERLLPTSLMNSYVIITLVILCGCLFIVVSVPLLLNWVKGKVSHDAPVIHYFASDAVRLSAQSRVVCCAFFIAITANIGMNLMINSFRAATEHWIGSQFSADFYLSTKSPSELKYWAEQNQHSLYHRRSEYVSFRKSKTELISKIPVSFGTISTADVPKEKDKQQHSVSNPMRTIKINQQMAYRHGLAIGDSIPLKGENFQITDVYVDYGNMFNQAMVPESLLQQGTDATQESQRFALNIYPSATKVAVKQQLDSLGAKYYSGADIKNITLKVFDQTFVITSGINLVTLLVAAISLASSIVILDKQNRHQINILNALGIQKTTMALGSLAQYSYLITIIFFLAVPFGTLLSYLLINKINLEAFFWTYPLRQDFYSYAVVYFATIIVVIFVCSTPVLISKIKTIIGKQMNAS